MGPLVAVVSSCLFRVAGLIERGQPPAKALRQVANELIEYEVSHADEMVPNQVIDLSLERKPTVRAV